MFGTAVALVSALGLLAGVDRWWYNVLFELRGPVKPKTPIVIVSIDEDSFDELNLQWPWPRAVHAQFLDMISRGKPAAIGFDIVFAEPSSLGADDDSALRDAVGRAGNVVLGAAFTEVSSQYAVKIDLNPPIPLLREGAAAFGFVNFAQDKDAFVRSAVVRRAYQDSEFLSFDHHLYRLGVNAGIDAAPLPEREPFLINYRGGPKSFLTVPYYAVLNEEVPPDVFTGALVLVGATSPVLHDIFPTPFAVRGNMPGVEIHANVLETLFQGIAIRKVSAALIMVLILSAGMATVWLTERLRPLLALGLIIVIVAAYVAATFALFAWGRLWMEVASVPGVLLLGYGAIVVENFIREQREKRRLSRYFSPAVVEDIIGQKDDINLTSGRRRITILFSDIRGFTSISEKMAPEDVVAFLREYLTVMTDAVFQYGGTVDKYIGDAIMALYNAPLDQPDHAARAVRTALAFQERITPLNARFEERYGIDLRCGVGIHTGDAVVGTIGSEQRLEYTAIGDTINLGSRLEGVTKDFHVSIVLSESTKEELGEEFLTRYLGEIVVKGKEITVKIYTVAEASTRKEPRIPVEATADILDEEVTIHAQVLDLSRGGVALRNLPKRFTKGQVLPIVLELAGGAPPLRVTAKVAWSTDDRAGFAFLDLQPGERATIEECLLRCPPPSVAETPATV